MKALRQVEVNLELGGATLLSEEEFLANRDIIPPSPVPWWLRTNVFILRNPSPLVPYVPSKVSAEVKTITPSDEELWGIRPAVHCRLDGTGISPGDSLLIRGIPFTALRGDYLLCDVVVDHCFYWAKGVPPEKRQWAFSNAKECVQQFYQNVLLREKEPER